MIICTHEMLISKSVTKNLSDSQIEVSLFDKNKGLTHIGLMRLMSDIGLTVILKIKNYSEMSYIKSIIENTENLDVLFVYPDIKSDDIKKIDVMFKDTSLSFIKTNESLLSVLEKHKKENKSLYENYTSTQIFISGLSKNIDESATLFTNNICTLYKDRTSVSDEQFFYLDVDIDNGQELTRLLKYYINDEYEYDSIENISLKTLFMTKSMLDLYDKMHLLMALFKNK